jgi:AmmeMemoRadiSam system protein A
MLTDAQRRTLLELARRAIQAAVAHENLPQPLAAAWPKASGVFVTIKRHGELRGCLGTLECRRDLPDEVGRCAADAARKDTRFAPVSARELPELTVEISVLGPLEAIDPGDPASVIVGRHGLVVEQGGRRGLLLPQVASEQDWTREEFLRQTSVKAGLSGDAWQHGARVSRFDAEVFGE